MIERFLLKVAPPSDGGCVLWTGSKCYDGYGIFTVGGRRNKKSVKAHRVAWQIERGTIPAGISVLHRCDVRSCVAVEHLFLGTRADNNADMFAKGRARTNSGEENGNSKLTASDVLELRRLYASGRETQRGLAKLFGVTQKTAAQAIKKQTWATVRT